MLSNRFFQHICAMFKSFQFIAIWLPVRFPLNCCSAVIGTFHLQILPLQFILFFGENHFRNWGQAKNENRSFIILILSQLNKLQKDISARLRSLLKLYFTPLKNKTKGEVIEPRNNCCLIVNTGCPSGSLSKLTIIRMLYICRLYYWTHCIRTCVFQSIAETQEGVWVIKGSRDMFKRTCLQSLRLKLARTAKGKSVIVF